MAARKPKQRRGPPALGAPQPGRPGPQGQGAPGGSWAPLRDAVRRDIEQALGALAFASTVHERLESQRRLFADFPRVTEQIRSGPFERAASALARLYEGKDQFDLSRFLRDLPLALAQLAASEARRSAPPPPASAEAAAAPSAQENQAKEGEAGAPQASGGAPESSPPPAQTESAAAPPAEAAPETPAPAESATASQPPPPSTPAASPESAGPPSPRVELRTRMLAAVPQLSKAVLTYRRTVATVRRAAAPRRSPGPWRSDREVLEEAQRAIEIAHQMFDAYAEAWADQPVQPGIAAAMSAEADRFLAWTQLSRYVDLAGRGATQGSPGAGGQTAEPSGKAPRTVEPPKQAEPAKPPEAAEPAAEPSAPEESATQGSPGAGGEAAP